MKKYIYSLSFAIATLLVGCSEDKGNYSYEAIDDINITLPANLYNVVSGGQLKITPTLAHSLEESGDLSYVWEVDGEVISTERDLDVLLPPMNFSNKPKVGALTVTDNTTGMKFIKTFNVNIVGEISVGYYFLTEDDSQNSVLAFISVPSETNPEPKVIQTQACSDLQFASNPVEIVGKFSSYSLMGRSDNWAIALLNKGDNGQALVIDGSTYMPKSVLSESSFVDKIYSFSPEAAFFSQSGDLFIISNGQMIMYRKGLLYRPAKHDKEYYWQYPIPSSSGYGFCYVHDKLSDKYYALKSGTDRYAYDTVMEVENSPSLNGQHMVGVFSVLRKGDFICTADAAGLHIYQFSNVSTKSFSCNDGVTLPVSGAGADTKAVNVNKLDWYFFIGNKVYTSPVDLPKLSEYLTIPEEYGKVTSATVSAKQKRLVITTYNENSDSKLKGSVLFIDVETKEITAFKNTIHRGVSCLAANESTSAYYDIGGDGF